MKFRESKPEDFDYVIPIKERPQLVDFYYTLEHEGNVVGVGGIRLITSATAWCWFTLTEHAEGHTKTVYRVLKEWILIMVKEKKIKRLQAHIDPDSPEAIRTVQHLGFEKECIMEGFLGDKNALLYKRIF